MSERQQEGRTKKAFKSALTIATLVGAGAATEAAAIVPHNQENSDTLIASSELGRIPSLIETSIINAESLHNKDAVSDIQNRVEGQNASLRIIPDEMHQAYVSPGQENIVVDESSEPIDSIGRVEKFDQERTLLLGRVEFSSTTKINLYKISEYDADGTPRFDGVEEITQFSVTNPEVHLTEEGLDLIAEGKLIQLTWSDIVEAMGGETIGGNLVINGVPVTIELPAGINEVLANNGHKGDFLTKTDMSPMPVASAGGNVTAFNQSLEEASTKAAIAFSGAINGYLVTSDGRIVANGDYRVGHIDDVAATVTVGAPMLESYQ